MPKIIRDASGKFVRTADEADQMKQETYSDRKAYSPQELEAALEAMAPKVLPKAPPKPVLEIDPVGFLKDSEQCIDRKARYEATLPDVAPKYQKPYKPPAERPVKKVIVVYALRPSEVLDVFFAVVTLLFACFCSAAVGMFLLDLLLTQMPDIIDALAQKVLGQ